MALNGLSASASNNQKKRRERNRFVHKKHGQLSASGDWHYQENRRAFDSRSSLSAEEGETNNKLLVQLNYTTGRRDVHPLVPLNVPLSRRSACRLVQHSLPSPMMAGERPFCSVSAMPGRAASRETGRGVTSSERFLIFGVSGVVLVQRGFSFESGR